MDYFSFVIREISYFYKVLYNVQYITISTIFEKISFMYVDIEISNKKHYIYVVNTW